MSKPSPEELQKKFIYDPDTGELTRRRTMQPVYLTFMGTKTKPTGAYLMVNYKRVNARGAIIAMQTNKWPDPHQYRFIGEDPKDLRWDNFFQRVDGENRRCFNCGEMKHQDNFHRKNGRYQRNWSSYCKDCDKLRRSISARKGSLKRDFGLTPEKYDVMLAMQGGVCAICKKKCIRNLAVDHCHTTNTVRELLCMRCNVGLGAFDDDPRRMLEAAQYLIRHVQAP